MAREGPPNKTKEEPKRYPPDVECNWANAEEEEETYECGTHAFSVALMQRMREEATLGDKASVINDDGDADDECGPLGYTTRNKQFAILRYKRTGEDLPQVSADAQWAAKVD